MNLYIFFEHRKFWKHGKLIFAKETLQYHFKKGVVFLLSRNHLLNKKSNHLKRFIINRLNPCIWITLLLCTYDAEVLNPTDIISIHFLFLRIVTEVLMTKQAVLLKVQKNKLKYWSTSQLNKEYSYNENQNRTKTNRNETVHTWIVKLYESTTT